MKRAWPTTAKILTGFFVTAMYAMPQAYTISAKPGVVNYIEGNAFLNGRPIETQNLKATFLNANDTISTDIGKAEVLLSPGVFLRVGENSQVRMISPSLTDTQIELKTGEAMVEADDILKDNRVTVIDRGNTVVVERSGLYKFSAGDAPKVAVLEGKLDVYDGDRKTEVGKGHEFLLGQAHKTEKFDAKKGDDLFAWSSVRSQYNAASSYQAAKDVNASSYGGVWGDFGFSGFANPGWMWNSGFNSWAWLPGGTGAYYSPFGYGFYGPGMVGYAPVIYAPLYGGGGGYYTGNQKRPVATNAVASAPATKMAAIPVNAVHPPATGTVASSPFAHSMASTQTLHTYSSSGFRTASGVTVPAGKSSAGGSSNVGYAGRASSGSGGYAGVPGNSISTGHVSGGPSGASAGGAHGGAAAAGGGAHR